MHKIYEKWPEIARESYDANHEQADFKDIDHIIFAGMGGSGTLGDVFSSILSKSKIHVCAVKGYHLPNTINNKTLVVATSVSGNTVETLSVLDFAVKSGCKTIAFCSGGKMEKYCKKNKINHRKIPQIHSPRASFVEFLYHMIKILEPIISIKKIDIHDSISKLENMREKISSYNLNKKNPSLNFAEWIDGIPLIYYPWGLNAAAIRFKNCLQENAKMHAMIEDVIEASHNGIVSWERPSNVKPILLQGKDDYFKTKERWKILQEYFNKNKIDYRSIYSLNGSILTKLINMIYFLDYTTIYRAIISRIDPSPVNSINWVKSKI